MNPFKMINPMMNIANQARQMQSDPSQLGKVLFDNGKIDQNTYNAIKGMNSPSQIGNYLMQNGILGQNQIQGMIPQANQIQQMM